MSSPAGPGTVDGDTPPPRRVLLLHGVSSSRTTWWRIEEDLTELGWEVTSVDLAGHGGRPAPRGALGVDLLAADVLDQLDDRPYDLVAGHSLGAVVALALAAAEPGLVGAVFLEDPPSLGEALDPADVAADIERSAPVARADRAAAVSERLTDNPRWALLDARNSVDNLCAVDVERVTAGLRDGRWDLPALVADCPVPVHLLAARGPATALTEPGRSEVLTLVSSATEVDSGHSVHRDRPGLWLQAFLRAARPEHAAHAVPAPQG